MPSSSKTRKNRISSIRTEIPIYSKKYALTILLKKKKSKDHQILISPSLRKTPSDFIKSFVLMNRDFGVQEVALKFQGQISSVAQLNTKESPRTLKFFSSP